MTRGKTFCHLNSIKDHIQDDGEEKLSSNGFSHQQADK
jgi:hypothetical protein